MKFTFASKSFGTQTNLAPLTLALEKGTVTALMGPSGSGKTTLLKMIAGLDQDDAQTPKSQLKIGMMFQEPRLLPWKTVRENIEVAGPADGLLEVLDLDGASAFYPRQLSLGMAKRVGFARAIASEPELLLLDEPFTSLDDARVDLLRMMISETKNRLNIPVLITTHDRADAEALQADIYALEGRPAKIRKLIDA
ncbi:MAG: ATP-binding cassette domain-containing protein [Alphaproteobacteria bacterium]